MEKRKKSLSPIRASINSISNVKPTPLSESPLRENAKTFQKYARPYSPPQNLSPELETRMREYMSTHYERLAKFKEAVYRQKEEMQEKMTEMMSLLEEYSNIKTPNKELLRKENATPTTKFVNSISIVYEGNEEKETPIAQTVEEPPKSQSLGYYLKHDINEKTITNWIEGEGRNRSSKRVSEGEEVG
jgi:hypothetical protein